MDMEIDNAITSPNAGAVVETIIRSRKAIRGFQGKPVSKTILAELLEVARRAPSNSNLQPGKVYVLSGAAKEALSADICQAHATRPEDYTSGYKHFPDSLAEPYESRRRNFGARYYGLLGIDPADMARRHAQTGRNFVFFGAPVGMIFTIDAHLERGSWVDFGIFIQTFMIAAKARGIDTCPQVSFAKYQAIIGRHLSLPPGEIVVCGMSVGYADLDCAVNALEMPRISLDAYASFRGFE
jgi:nitroreductase